MPVKTPQFQINIRKNDSVRSLAYGKYYPKAVEKVTPLYDQRNAKQRSVGLMGGRAYQTTIKQQDGLWRLGT